MNNNTPSFPSEVVSIWTFFKLKDEHVSKQKLNGKL